MFGLWGRWALNVGRSLEHHQNIHHNIINGWIMNTVSPTVGCWPLDRWTVVHILSVFLLNTGTYLYLAHGTRHTLNSIPVRLL